MKKQTGKIILFAVLAIAALVFIFHKQVAAFFSKLKTPPTSPGKTDSGGGATKPSKFPLHLGSKDAQGEHEVENLQRFLNFSYSNYNLSTDGIFGPKTLEAVRQETDSDSISLDYYNNFIMPYINPGMAHNDGTTGTQSWFQNQIENIFDSTI